jgi:hypothetical protein
MVTETGDNMEKDKLYSKSKAPFADEEPEEPAVEVDSVMFYPYLHYVSEKKRYEIAGFAQVELYTDGSAEVVTVQPPEFEKFLEEHVYDQEDNYLELVSDCHVFNQMLASHWRQLPLMQKFNGYVGFIETDEEGLDKMIEEHGWRLDELEQEGEEPDEDKED